MATITQQPVTPSMSAVGAEPSLLELPEGASETFKKGMAVYLASDGVTVCGANPGKILGFAADDAHNDGTAGTHKVGVYLALPGTIFEGNLVTSGNANGNNASPTGATTAQALLGLSYGINQDGTNFLTTVDTSDTGGGKERVTVLAMAEQYGVDDSYRGTLGDIGARVLFTVMAAYSQALMLSA